MIVKIKCDTVPTYATAGSAGIDLCASKDFILKASSRDLIPTGVSIQLPDGYEAQIRSRSGLAYKNGIHVLNSPGTIDSDYRGEILVILKNDSIEDFHIEKGMRIAQMVIAKYEKVVFEQVDFFEETKRGAQGFGSTGV